MRNKILFCIILLLLVLPFAAAESYKIKIDNAEDVSVSDNLVVLTGNVRLSFSSTDSEGGSDPVSRTLRASKVTVDTNKKTLEALGAVTLENADDSFNGDCVVFNWDSLDVVVYGGTSSSERKNSSSESVEFYASGERISYAGGDSTAVMFKNGTISTTDSDDPNWSIRAAKLGLLGSDLVFENATVRIGRVPIMWLPMFFYPGTTMTFNPAMGISSSRGMFLNTTYEVWGKYPGLGVTGSSSSSTDDSSSAVSGFFSFMAGEDTKTYKDGIIYSPVTDDTKLSPLEQWAESSSSYMAVFADVYQKKGMAVGLDTLDKFGSIGSVSAKAIAALDPSEKSFKTGNAPRFRAAADFKASVSGSWNKLSGSFTLTIPYYTDPYVRTVFFNRNTVFGLDSVLGTQQYFPTNYSSTDNKFTWSLDSNLKYSIGNYTFNLSSLKATVNWKWDSTKNKYEISDATLPYVSFSSSGDIVSLEGEKKSITLKNRYQTELARIYGKYLEEFELADEETAAAEASKATEELLETETVEEPSEADQAMAQKIIEEADKQAGKGSGMSAELLSGPSYDTERSVSFSSSQFKLSYDFNEVFSDTFTTAMKPNTLSSDTSGDLVLTGRLPYDSFYVTATTTPKLNYVKNSVSNTLKKDFTIDEAVSASIPIAGISYVVKGSVMKLSESNGELTKNQYFQWSSDYVTTHYIQLSKTIGNFTLGYLENLKPVTETIVPSVAWSYSGCSVSASSTFYIGDQFLKKGNAQVNTSYSGDILGQYFSFSMTDKYDYSKTGWSGFTLTQNSSLGLFSKILYLKESVELKDKFTVDTLKLSVSAYDNTAEMTFAGAQVKPDTFSVTSKLKVDQWYLWKHRIGFSGNLNSKLSYDFNNKYATSFTVDFSMVFSVYKFLDITLSVQSANTSFYRYYEDSKFKFGLLFQDLLRSFDFFHKANRENTGFNMSALSLKAVHYMEDWNFYVDVTEKIVSTDGVSSWKPEVNVYIKWKAIPELKVQNKWTKTGWEK